jgi:CBS domain-containing protein
MDSPFRRPEQILAYRPLQRILESKRQDLWIIGPADTVLSAMQIMAEKNIGFLVVMKRNKLIGVVSERDCTRYVALAKRSPESTTVADIMIRNVVTVNIAHTFAECLKLMHQHSIRHLPVVDNGKVVTVVSIRDLLGEAVNHNAKIIEEIERERLEIFTSMA